MKYVRRKNVLSNVDFIRKVTLFKIMKHAKIPVYIIVAAAIIISSTSMGTRVVSAATSIDMVRSATSSPRGHKEGNKRGSSHSGSAVGLSESAPHGVMGTISLVNGTSITLLSGTTTYVVDASNAKIIDPSSAGTVAPSSISNLKIGDAVAVRGTISGTSITATAVFDGVFKHGPSGKNNPAAIKARHYQGIIGIVSALNGTTLTVDGKEATSTATSTYTVDASAAKVLKTSIKGKASVSDIAVGDTVRISGDIVGQSVTAKVILDGQPRTQGLQLGKSHRKNG